MKIFKSENKKIDISYRNVLVNYNHNINHVSKMAEHAILLGYPLILWNGRVYFVEDKDNNEYTIADTQFLETDIA
jgi:hypothetical protein